MSTDQLNGTSVLVDVPNIATDHICATEDISTATVTNENAAPIMQRVKNSNLLRTSPIVSAETKKRKRSAIDEDDYANAFADTTNIHNNSDAPLSPSESPTKKRKKLTDEEKAEREKQRLEREEKRQQELKEKEERRLKKEEERKQKETEREEQKLMREEEKRRKDEEKKKKEEDKEKLRLEREEEKRRKEEERKKKEEEKRKKDDERKKKEEDKRRKEEERERAEEDKKRQAEKKRAYWGQFKAATASGEGTAPHRLQTSREIAAPSTSVRSWSTELFRAWQPAVSAVIAPLHRWQARDLSSFEQQLAAQNVQVSVAALPKPPRATRRSVLAARKARRVAHYQQVIDLSGAADPQLNPLTDRLLHARFKYLNFHENVRPAYYGTFTAQCRHVTARRPLGKDERTFGDYEYDSDEDWEEEEGEDLDAMSERSEDEQQANTATKELEGEEDYCYDGEFLVADGYLSDEEGLKSDNDDDEDERDPLLTPADLAPKTEEQRARDAERRQERMKKMMAHKKRVAECQAVVAGPIYHPSSAEERVRALITCYPVELLLAQPIDPRTPLAEELDEEVVTATPNKAKVVPDALVPDLIRILHGASSRSHVIDAFHKLHAHISKRQIERKIVEIASRGQVDDGKQVWVVRPEIVARYSGSASQVLPNLEVKQSDTAAVSITQFFGSAPQSDLVHVSRESAVVDTCHSAPMVQ